MCCNGALFARAKVKDDEEDRRLGTLDFSLVDLDGKRHFRQPCSYEKSCSCSIYQTRPDVCRAFRCKLLKKHDAGEIDSADAREKIAKAKNLRAAVAALDPEAANDGPRQEIWRALAQQFPGLTGAERQHIRDALDDLPTLHTFDVVDLTTVRPAVRDSALAECVRLEG